VLLVQFTEIIASGGHNVDLLVSTAYSRFEHHVGSSTTKRWIQQHQAAAAAAANIYDNSSNSNIVGSPR